MSENKTIMKWEDRFTEEISGVTKEKQEVANMDFDDSLNLLMESRIIQAS